MFNDHLRAVLSLSRSVPSRAQSPEDLHREVRTQASTISDPIAFYEKLKSSGALTKESCHAILFNSNLTDYNSIIRIALENCIPPSYVVAKLMKLDDPPPAAIHSWMKKVPPLKALWAFIYDGHKQPMSLGQVSNRMRCLAQAQMDLTAHMSFIIMTEGIEPAFDRWKRWLWKDLPVPHREILKLPSLKLLHHAMQGPGNSHIIREILHWQPSLLLSAPKQEFHRHWVRQFLQDCINPEEDCPYKTAISVVELSEKCLEPDETAKYTSSIVGRWVGDSTKMPASVPSIRSMKAFLYRTISGTGSASFFARAELQHWKAVLEEMESYPDRQQYARRWGAHVNDSS